VGLTAGASAPDILVQQVIERLRELGACRAQDGRRAGDVHFPLPKGLGDRSMSEFGGVAILTPRCPTHTAGRHPVPVPMPGPTAGAVRPVHWP
jgi:hypothetical protein